MNSVTEIVNRMEALLEEMLTNKITQREAAHQEALTLSRELFAKATNAGSEQYCLEYDMHVERLAAADFGPDRNRSEFIDASQAIDKLRSGHGFNLR